MRSRFTPRLGGLLVLGLATVLTAAACTPDAPPPPTTAPSGAVAVAAATPQPPGYYGLPVQFASTGSTPATGATLTAFLWTFGDGSATSPLPNPTHTYSQPGTYVVSLKVTDSASNTNTTTINVVQANPAGPVTLLPSPVTSTAAPLGGTTFANVRVWWNGQVPSTLIFVDICRKSVTDPTFIYGVDCSLGSNATPNGTVSGSGTLLYQVFRGENPDGDNGSGTWGCFNPSDGAAAGVQKNTTCYLKVTNNSVNNKTDAKDIPFTLVN
jgi:hypothetical protein